MANKGDIYKVALPNGDEYNFKDKYVRENYRALNNNDFDTINVTELNSGNLINTGAARFLNTINGSISGNAATASDSAKLNGYASDTAASNNTIARRTANGYIFATYFNQSSGAETPTSSSYIIYANSDGYFRKSTVANMKTAMSLNNVENKSSATIRGEITSSNVTTALGYTPVNKAGDTMTGALQIGSSSQSALPSVGLTIHDVRNTTITSTCLSRAVNFFFTNKSTDRPSTEGWVSIMHMQGWNGTESYNSWELLGPAGTGDQRTTPLYVRSSNGATWGDWRKIYDTSNKPSKSDVGLGNVDNTADANKSVNYATSAGSANTATSSTNSNYLVTPDGRSVSADIDLSTASRNTKLFWCLASSSMTTSSPGEGYITTWSWDWGGYGAQLFMPQNPTQSAKRRCSYVSGTSDWGDWITLLDSNNYTSYTVKKDGTGASGTWGISITGNAATATKATQDSNGNTISSTYVKVTGDPTIFKASDIAEGAANLSTQATAHRVTVYRNGMTIPYQMDNANDGGMIRVRGTSESDCIFELGTWDDSGAGETIQFNYYPTTSQVTPTYSVVVPKKSGTIMLTNDTYSGTLTKSQVTTALGYTPPTSDTNYYHTTGSWSGLTYTATANGGAGALAFTIPTGTSATTVAVGNHNHNGTYVKVAGDSMTGTLCMNSANGDFGEGIRINAGNGGYSSLTIGTEANSTRGISDCGFWIGTNRTNTSYQRKLYVAHNGSTQSSTYFYADSSSQRSPNLRIGGTLGVGNAGATKTCQMKYNENTDSLDFVFAA